MSNSNVKFKRQLTTPNSNVKSKCQIKMSNYKATLTRQNLTKQNHDDIVTQNRITHDGITQNRIT